MDCLGLLVFIICGMCVVYVSLSCGALAVAYFNQPTWHPLYPAIQEDYQEEYPTWHKGSSHCEAYPVNLTMETVWNSPCMWFPRRDLRSYFAYIGTNKDRVNTIKSINRQGCQQVPYCFILFSSCFRFEHFPTRCRSIPLPILKCVAPWFVPKVNWEDIYRPLREISSIAVAGALAERFFLHSEALCGGNRELLVSQFPL